MRKTVFLSVILLVGLLCGCGGQKVDQKISSEKENLQKQIKQDKQKYDETIKKKNEEEAKKIEEDRIAQVEQAQEKRIVQDQTNLIDARTGIYKNTEFGFQIQLINGWKKAKAEKEWIENQQNSFVSFEVNGCLFSVSIVNEKNWNDCQNKKADNQEEMYECNKERELGRNKGFVFVYGDSPIDCRPEDVLTKDARASYKTFKVIK